MKCAMIIVAAGSGTRFKSKTPKPFVLLRKKPLIVHSLTVFERCINIDSIVIVGHGDYLAKFKAIAKRFKKVTAVVKGGATRADSVKQGLKAIDQTCDIVCVHDAARPLVNLDMMARIFDALKKSPAVITAVPAKATIKEVSLKTMNVVRTLPRATLWEVQTPQGFSRVMLEKAHARATRFEATDDAMLLEHLGVKVKVVMGDYRNIKITTPEDLLMADVLI